MMGGGFGGCTINLVKISELETFKDIIHNGYNQNFGITPDFIPVKIGHGARLV
jgi:galactokinase